VRHRVFGDDPLELIPIAFGNPELERVDACRPSFQVFLLASPDGPRLDLVSRDPCFELDHFSFDRIGFGPHSFLGEFRDLKRLRHFARINPSELTFFADQPWMPTTGLPFPETNAGLPPCESPRTGDS
jgi:hypothetical protein